MGTSKFDAGEWPCDGLVSYPGESRNTSSLFMLLKLEIGARVMGHLDCIQIYISPCYIIGQHFQDLLYFVISMYYL